MNGITPNASNFLAILQRMEAGALDQSLQNQALAAISRVLSSVPEGRPLAIIVDAEVAGMNGESAPVKPHVLNALKASAPILEGAASKASSLEDLTVLQSILEGLPHSSPLSNKPLDRVREAGRARLESPATRLVAQVLHAPGARLPVLYNHELVQKGRDIPNLIHSLSVFFGNPVTPQMLAEAFWLPHNDYRVASVGFKKDIKKHLHIQGQIRMKRKRKWEPVGVFGVEVPPAPQERGILWSARAGVINIDPVESRKGLGGRLLLGAAKFLHDVGVHALEADAEEAAGPFCVAYGFKPDRARYEALVDEFWEEMSQKGIKLSEDDRIRLLEKGNLWDLYSFTIEGRLEGRAFLDRIFQRTHIPLRFWLNADNSSWLRLLSKLKNGDDVFPVEWEGLSPQTREALSSNLSYLGNVPQILSSDSDHADHILERLNNWLLYVEGSLAYSDEVRARLPAERRLEIEEDIKEKIEAISDVLEMIASNTSAPLFLHFRRRVDPGRESMALSGGSRSHGPRLADMLLKADGKKIVILPPDVKRIFEEMRSLED